MRFALRMAWRDFRAKPSRFILYVVAIAIGVGSLTAIESFRRELASVIDAQGRNLLGADVLFKSRRLFTDEQMRLMESWPGPRAQLISYRTMLLEPARGATRLVEVQAFDDAYPFYGGIQTEPVEAEQSFKSDGSALVDDVLLIQLGLKRGDTIELGGIAFRIAGAIKQTPGEVPARSLIAPRVFVPLRTVNAERFERPGMMARFEWYAAESPGGMAEREAFIKKAKEMGLSVDTVTERREELLGGTDRMSSYLGLMGFTALMIGCLGVAGAVQFFVQSKHPAVAQLRCIGASLHHAAGLFVVQLVFMAGVGATLGVGLGALLGRVIPSLLAQFIPVPVASGFRWDAAVLAWLIGVLFTVLAGMFPITRLRKISPLLSLRYDLNPWHRSIDLAGGITLFLLAAALFSFATIQLGRVTLAAAYIGGMVAVVALLAATGMLLRYACRRLIRARWSYAFRLAVSALYRPQNQTALLLVSLGLGVFLLSTVNILEQHVIEDVEVIDKDRPNIAMVDIQLDQREGVVELLNRYGPTSVFIEPMITMRLAGINGVGINELEEQPEQTRENWALKREFRATYRSATKPEIEKVIAGEWVERVAPGVSPVPVSLEEGIAKALQVGLGDRLTFDIHGEMMETRVANLREADWKSMQPNFFLIFPEGVLEQAPQSMLVFTQLDDLAARAEFQSAVARQFPNITSIDVSLMMNSVSSMLGQLAAAVRAIAWMTLLAGFLVLMAILRAGRAVRMREAILLRTIGAPTSSIIRYNVYELLLLALGAVGSGLLLSWASCYLIVRFGLKMDYAPVWWSSLGTIAALLAVVILFGWWQGRIAARKQPAEAWRSLSLTSA